MVQQLVLGPRRVTVVVFCCSTIAQQLQLEHTEASNPFWAREQLSTSWLDMLQQLQNRKWTALCMQVWDSKIRVVQCSYHAFLATE